MVRIDGITQIEERTAIKAWVSPDIVAAIVAGDLIYLDAEGEWQQAGGSANAALQADAVALTGCTVAEASGAEQDALIVGVTHGRVSGDFSTLAKGVAIQTSEVTMGEVAQGNTTNTRNLGIVVQDNLALLHVVTG